MGMLLHRHYVEQEPAPEAAPAPVEEKTPEPAPKRAPKPATKAKKTTKK